MELLFRLTQGLDIFYRSLFFSQHPPFFLPFLKGGFGGVFKSNQNPFSHLGIWQIQKIHHPGL